MRRPGVGAVAWRGMFGKGKVLKHGAQARRGKLADGEARQDGLS
jgi:hypothetical protein